MVLAKNRNSIYFEKNMSHMGVSAILCYRIRDNRNSLVLVVSVVVVWSAIDEVALVATVAAIMRTTRKDIIMHKEGQRQPSFRLKE